MMCVLWSAYYDVVKNRTNHKCRHSFGCLRQPRDPPVFLLECLFRFTGRLALIVVTCSEPYSDCLPQGPEVWPGHDPATQVELLVSYIKWKDACSRKNNSNLPKLAWHLLYMYVCS